MSTLAHAHTHTHSLTASPYGKQFAQQKETNSNGDGLALEKAHLFIGKTFQI